MSRIDVRRNARVSSEVGGTYTALPLRPIENNLNLNSRLLAVNKGLSDGADVKE